MACGRQILRNWEVYETLLQPQRARQLSARWREHPHAQIVSRSSCNMKTISVRDAAIKAKECRIKRVSPASGGTQCPLPGWMDLRVVYLSSQTVRLWKLRMKGKTNERQGSSVYLFRSEAYFWLWSWFLCLTCVGTETFELTPACEESQVSITVLPRRRKA